MPEPSPGPRAMSLSVAISEAMSIATMTPCLTGSCGAKRSHGPQNDEVLQIDFSRVKVSAFDEEDAEVAAHWAPSQLWEPVIWCEVEDKALDPQARERARPTLKRVEPAKAGQAGSRDLGHGVSARSTLSRPKVSYWRPVHRLLSFLGRRPGS